MKNAISSSVWRSGLIGLIGLSAGAAAALNWMIAEDYTLGWVSLVCALAGGGVLGLTILLGLDRLTGALAQSLPAEARQRLARYDWLTYLPALLTILGFWGIHFPPPVMILMLLVLCKAAVLFAAVPADQRRGVFTSMGWLAFLFLISGFAALIYQIVWQRTLFTAFGVNIESITIIVSLFMFGLGLGSLVGGLLSRKYPDKAPWLFFICEAGIGLFGVVSLPLIGAVSRATLHGSLLTVSLAVFALLCIPTMLMGATLPILVGHLYRQFKSVGKSVGLLYCINTVGSAIACFLTADLLFVVTGQQGSVLVAAACNVTVGLLVLRFAWSIARKNRQLASTNPEAADQAPAVPVAEPQAAVLDCSGDKASGSSLAHRAFVLFFAAATGYISLSQEMVWMRIVSFMTGGSPSVFAHVLGFFLVGVAAGAYYAERVCERAFPAGRSPARFIGVMLLVAGAFYYAGIAGIAWVHAWSGPLGLLGTHVAVAVLSFLLGGIFPVLCHYGARAGQSVGLAVSRLYVANIVGSTLGPLLTGFVLMQYASTETIILGLSVGTVALGGLALLLQARPVPAVPLAACAAVVAAMFLGNGTLYRSVLENLQCDRPAAPFHYVLENRSGIISITPDAIGEACYGGGKYDGRFNTDPVVNSNWITRCYMIAALHPNPEEVLEVGIATASWTRVMANYPAIKHVTAVEINPGYLDIIRHFPEQGSILSDPKVTVCIDDGRRWLNRHPEAMFDFILQNTTWHWRSQITNLVSDEYLQLCKSHLKPGGVLYYNTTDSEHIAYTAARAFKYVVKYGNFIAASDRPFDPAPDQVRADLKTFAYNGKPAFDPSDERYVKSAEYMATCPLPDLAEDLRARQDLWRITDDNMATEYKRVWWVNLKETWCKFLQSDHVQR